MDADTAKKLKKAGFPQLLDNAVWDEEAGMVSSDTHSRMPELEELIEACTGEGTFSMDIGYAQSLAKYWASLTTSKNPNKYEGEGRTLIEAVANLWIALNNK